MPSPDHRRGVGGAGTRQIVTPFKMHEMPRWRMIQPMSTRLQPARESATTHLVRLGSVSFLNAKPLIWGIDDDPTIELHLDVPARLLDGLRSRRFDVALLPVIDYQRMAGLRLITSAGIGADGQTLTVRIFSRVPIEQITTLACDTDSHTSVALARVIFAEYIKAAPTFVDLDDPQADRADARLLIGDKVVCEEPSGFAHQLDLGVAWKQLTGLPFVFAAWMAASDAKLGDLPERLVVAKHEGLTNVDAIIQRYGTPRGWPAPTLRVYLTRYMRYDIGDRELEAIRLFHSLAERHGIIESARELDLVAPTIANDD